MHVCTVMHASTVYNYEYAWVTTTTNSKTCQHMTTIILALLGLSSMHQINFIRGGGEPGSRLLVVWAVYIIHVNYGCWLFPFSTCRVYIYISGEATVSASVGMASRGH